VRYRHRIAACSAILGMGIAVAAGLAAPVAAHPFGVPPTARIWADGYDVGIEWGAAPDDAIVIGVELGLLDEETIDAYLDQGPTRVAPSAEKERRLSESEELRGYLLERIRVVQGRSECDPTIRPIENFVTQGAHVVFRCPREVETVDVEISMLHEVHEAYRTFAFSAGDAKPAQAVFTVASPVHTWTFGVEADGDSSGRALQLGLIALGLLAVVGVILAELASDRGRAQEDEAS
jgi:hypothetical protein